MRNTQCAQPAGPSCLLLSAGRGVLEAGRAEGRPAYNPLLSPPGCHLMKSLCMFSASVRHHSRLFIECLFHAKHCVNMGSSVTHPAGLL